MSSIPSRPHLLPWLLSKANRLGVEIDVVLLTREGIAPAAEVTRIDPRFRCELLGVDDIDAMMRAEPGTNPAVCAERFAGPFLCLGVRDGDRLVAKMWCDLAECSDPTCRRLLGEREAYLFSAFTDPAYRGQNLAPYIRQAFYATLRARGRDHIFSCTDYFNLAARRFKAKLGALDEALLLGVTLFGRYRRTLTLRRYRPREPV